MRPKHNILFLASWYPNRTLPTDGNFVKRHADAVALTHNVAALHVSSDGNMKNTGFEIKARMVDEVYTVNVYYPKVRTKFWPFNWLMKLQRYRKAHRLGLQKVKEYMPSIDLVHVNVLFPVGMVALRLKQKMNIPYLITEHWSGYQPINRVNIPKWQKWLSKMITSQAEYVLPVSQNLANMMQQYGLEGNYDVVPNVVKTSLFNIADKPGAQEKKQILHISTLHEEAKNAFGILRGIKQLSEIRQDFELLIVTEGNMDAHVKYAEELGVLDHYVKFMGTQPIEAIAQIMQKADLFLLFSNYENLPCVIIESLASGVPVVTTNVGGIAEMVNDTNGILIPAGDETQLVEKLDHMLNHHQDYDKQALRAMAVERFSYESVGKQFSKLYDTILGS